MSLPKIEAGSSSSRDSQTVVLGFFQQNSEKDKQSPSPVFVAKPARETEAVVQQVKEGGFFSARKNETVVLRFYPIAGFRHALLLGLGSGKKWTSEVARQAGAALYQCQKKEKLERVALHFESIFSSTPAVELNYTVQAFCEGYLLASYEFTEFKKTDKNAFYPKGLELGVSKDAARFKQAAEKAKVLVAAVHTARLLGDRPGNVCTPAHLAKHAQDIAKSRSLKVTVLGRAQLEKEKMGLFLGVAQGSKEEPKLIQIEYRGGRKDQAPIVLAGKGVTFDSGGISIKPSPQMEEMKYDMMGAAGVIGMMQAAADLKLPVRLIGLIGAVENMPSGTAQKPGDIRSSMSGKTVEINNTDAEGRLVLADVLEYAQRFEPQAIFDFATLTGAVIIALGSVTTGIMGTSPELISRLKNAGELTGEKVWELPLYEEYNEDLKSAYADLRNTGSREAGSSKGGMFLKNFVPEKIPWVHCDIAGTAFNRKDVNYLSPKFATGAMVRLITQMLENWQPLAK